MRTEIVSDEIEQEVACDTSDASVSCLAHGAVQFAQPKMHSIIGRRDCEAL